MWMKGKPAITPIQNGGGGIVDDEKRVIAVDGDHHVCPLGV
jgi:hypothetical protein